MVQCSLVLSSTGTTDEKKKRDALDDCWMCCLNVCAALSASTLMLDCMGRGECCFLWKSWTTNFPKQRVDTSRHCKKTGLVTFNIVFHDHCTGCWLHQVKICSINVQYNLHAPPPVIEWIFLLPKHTPDIPVPDPEPPSDSHTILRYFTRISRPPNRYMCTLFHPEGEECSNV